MKLARLSLIATVVLAGTAHAQTLIGGAKTPPTFPIVISQPGSYKLAGNLVVPAGVSAILIHANDITLDLNGYTLQGPNKCSPNPGGPGVVCALADASVHGIDTTATQNVVVRNGTVRGFAGVGVSLAAGSRAEALMVAENAAVGLYVGSGSVGTAIVSRYNRGGGVYANNAVLSDVTAEMNGGAGGGYFNGGVGLKGASVLRVATSINNASFAVSGSSTSGYRDVMMISAGGAYSSGPVSLGGNLCGGVPC